MHENIFMMMLIKIRSSSSSLLLFEGQSLMEATGYVQYFIIMHLSINLWQLIEAEHVPDRLVHVI